MLRGARQNSLVTLTALSVLGVPGAALAAGGLNLQPGLGLLIANLVVLGLLIYPTQRLLLAPLVRIFEQREQRTTGAMARAEEVRVEAAAVHAELDKRLVQARADAQARRSAILSEAEGEEQEILELARAEVARTLEALRSSIAEEAADARRKLHADARALSREAASKILGRSL